MGPISRRPMANAAVFVTIVAAVAIPAAIAAQRSAAASARVGFRIGDSAPDFELPSAGGGMIRLASYRGHPVLVNFWATWCGPCRVEIPWLVEIDLRDRGRGLRIVGVNMDDPGTDRRLVSAFAKERSVAYPVLFGTQQMADTFGGVVLMPESFFVDAGGVIVDRIDGVTTRADLAQRVKRLLARGSSP